MRDAGVMNAGVMKARDLRLDKIPEGKVLIDGKLTDITKRGLLLQQHPEQKEFFRATDDTIYHRSAAGQLRCVNKKKLTKAERKAAKRGKKKALFSAL